MAWTGWVHTPVPNTFVMIYAPRGMFSLLPLTAVLQPGRLELTELPGSLDDNDLRIVLKIIEAAIWYTTAEKVDLEGLSDS